MFNWEDFKNNKIAVHCDTEKKAKAFLKECEKHGTERFESINKDLNCWHTYKQNTCYIAHQGYIYYDSVKNSYFKRLYTIIDYPFDVVANKKIVITNDGRTTTAKLYNGKKLIKSAKADCHPDDKFDVITGAELALSRLKEKEFRPYLKDVFNGEKYGYIGEETELTAPFGEPLYVGDIVELYDIINDEVRGFKFVCKTEDYKKGFIMGIVLSGITKNGITKNNNWQIRKIKSYKDLQNEEEYDEVEVVMKERK